MAKTLIIYAHPQTPGHNPLILEQVQKSLKKNQYEVIDLYKIGYDPILHENEHYTSGRENRNLSDQNLKFQEKIKKAEHLIFIFPVWWNSPPAILKGFFEKVFTVKFGFVYKGKIPQKLLKGRKAAIFLTTGAPRLLGRIFLGDRAAKIVGKDILGFCGIKARAFYIDKATRVTDTQQEKIKRTVAKGLKWLH